MLNGKLFCRDPRHWQMMNRGVARVDEEAATFSLASPSLSSMEVLRYELETFVCSGQYQSCLEHILASFLDSLDSKSQPAVWLSGSFGSGKSHLLKMLKALWQNTVFPDGKACRDIAILPDSLRGLLQALDRAQAHTELKAVHSISGTLGSTASGNWRLAFLGLVFRSVGLPERYPQACFAMWLKQQGLDKPLQALAQVDGVEWASELDSFYLSTWLHAALVKLKPDLFPSQNSCLESINNLFSAVSDISEKELLDAVQQALVLPYLPIEAADRKQLAASVAIPLTVVILDELEQYILGEPKRCLEVQLLIEGCQKRFGSRLLFVVSGQHALSQLPALRKLTDRFSINMALLPEDIYMVVRQVLLLKNERYIKQLETLYQDNIEIIAKRSELFELLNRNRRLPESVWGGLEQERATFVTDYPILPVRRYFWELVWQALAQSDLNAQLRHRLSFFHQVLALNADRPFGSIVTADALFFALIPQLQEAQLLERSVAEHLRRQLQGNDDEQLMARACGLIFLFELLARAKNIVHPKATPECLCELLFSEVRQGSSPIEARLEPILDNCALITKSGRAYHWHNPESLAWLADYQELYDESLRQPSRLEERRTGLLRESCESTFAGIIPLQSRKLGVRRTAGTVYMEEPPRTMLEPSEAVDGPIYWIRDCWSTNLTQVLEDARQLSQSSPVIIVYCDVKRVKAKDLPLLLNKGQETDRVLRESLARLVAAQTTIRIRGRLRTEANSLAFDTINTILVSAQRAVKQLIAAITEKALVLQGGGEQLKNHGLEAKLRRAAPNALARLYPQFQLLEQAYGQVESLGDKAEASLVSALDLDHCQPSEELKQIILSYLEQPRTGKELSRHFAAPPFGWPQELLVNIIEKLSQSGLICANGQKSELKDLSKSFSHYCSQGCTFIAVNTPLSVRQRIEWRRLVLKAGLEVAAEQEGACLPEFLKLLNTLGQKVLQAMSFWPPSTGPDEVALARLQKIEGFIKTELNELLQLSISQQGANKMVTNNMDTSKMERQSSEFLLHSAYKQVFAIEAYLDNCFALVKQFAAQYYPYGQSLLRADPCWSMLTSQERNSLLPGDLLPSSSDFEHFLDNMRINSCWRILNWPSAISTALIEAASLVHPGAVRHHLYPQLFQTPQEVEQWTKRLQGELKARLSTGPVQLI